MGQKVHPIGFRVGITKRHQSQWFARFTKYAYAQSILEDRMLRKTLLSFATEALNTNTGKKRDSSFQQNPITPKITHIKIERGLIPYEIGIQIHAENCQKLKSSLNKENSNLAHASFPQRGRDLLLRLRLKKTRRYLISLGQGMTAKSNSLNKNLSLAGEKEIIQNPNNLSSITDNKKGNKSAVTSAFPLTVKGQKKKFFLFSISKKQPAILNLSSSAAYRSKEKYNSRISEFFSSKQPYGASTFRKRSNIVSKNKKINNFFQKQQSGLVSRAKMMIKRLRKRQEIRRRYRRLMLKGLFVQKKGKIILLKPSFFLRKSKQPLRGSSLKKSINAAKKKTQFFSNRRTKTRLLNRGLSRTTSPYNNNKGWLKNSGGDTKNTLARTDNKNFGTSLKKLSVNTFGRSFEFKKGSQEKKNLPLQAPLALVVKDKSKIGYRIKKKFVSLFLNKINKRFLKQLKDQMTTWNNKILQHRQEQLKIYGTLRFAPLGYNQKWSLKRLNFLKTKPLFKLLKLVYLIERKSLIKLETLRKDFIAFGTISKSEALNYYQILNFLKNLKDYVSKLKKEQKRLLVKTLTKGNSNNLNKRIIKQNSYSPTSNLETGTGLTKGLTVRNKEKQNVLNLRDFFQKQQSSLVRPALLKKLHLISGTESVLNAECRKINFIEYLKEIVKKHRTNNLYYYLSTISDARKNLKKIKQFTKLHSNFLFGLDLKDPTSINDSFKQKLQDRIKNVIDLSSIKASSFGDKGLPEIFLEQIEKQRTMYKQLAQLAAKISIKFYSVKSENMKVKASIITDSVIDALEKRKAFRKVIKDAKENLMRSTNVKGVKIQVAGRLNGAEIARTEWVRAGRVPLQTLRANLDYSYKTAKTIYGIIGVKVWIFKGYTKLV
uniref:Small ribosomal subunit protein uS3c n=1 Tax=Chloromonas radiata TaxID=47907 RepID=A0A0S2ICE5_9CHLO|nr:ribosomal protein S3 [Chloromonas radiata]